MDAPHNELPAADDLTPSPLYRTFVLRCWLEAQGDGRWRFSLLEVGNPAVRSGFTRLDDLVTYLQGVMAVIEADRRAGVDRLAEVFQRATSDRAYRQAFISDPVKALSEAGVAVPGGMTYQVIENTAQQVHIILPPLVPDDELGGEELEARATKSLLLCAAGPSHTGLFALLPGCNLAT